LWQATLADLDWAPERPPGDNNRETHKKACCWLDQYEEYNRVANECDTTTRRRWANFSWGLQGGVEALTE